MRRALLPCLWLLAAAAVGAAPRVERGELGGALYAVAVPEQWNGRLLLIAHGFRPLDQPLHAELHEAKPPHATLLADGWIVALTSYRRNGMILRDAIEDLGALREHIVVRHGAPTYTYLMGESMGGAIVTLIAEHFPDHYAGAIAIGAALDAREPPPTVGITLQPKLPVLYLTNRSELAGPARYVEAAAAAEKPPVVWRVDRDGHVNVNAAEKLAALAAVVRWVEQGVPPPAAHDATLAPAPGPSRVTWNDDASAAGVVTEVHPVYGNLTLDFQPDDLGRLGIEPHTWFALVVGGTPPERADGRVIRVFRGATFASVKRGEWVAFPDAEGWLTIAVNRGHAAQVAGLRAGEGVTLRRLRSE
ncbi:MAG TPA: alpha/beta hydrolase [Opitutaceae bacterium]|nr:alpha/beta hydrolase [Opitutaceae bacterium]